ncbi:hypothetical protein F441_23014 [Phytophthora nicotianae CJ01A1]|uniref:Uncharacterized protein n=2 Tax=Phytophthora nicotianae TaxID=4792 RepID=V9E7J2_PHYNI|nr:hypothetical protein F443_18551 [Phytophthora nicotianae P1569]ETO99571.1 hypothetical protein F441_23014 [Phytophthora nicotianae CJ01A1]
MATSNELPSEQNANSLSDAPLAKRRKTMVPFTDELDFQLIEEAQARNPFGEDYGEKTQARAGVAVAAAVDVGGRRCRERCNQLLDAYEAKQNASERRSGPCEDYTPKNECLAELLEMREMEMLLKNDKKQQKNQQEQEDGVGKEKQENHTSSLEQRDGVAHELDKRKISNEEKRFALEQRRLELQEFRMEQKRNERLAFIDMLKTVISKYNS